MNDDDEWDDALLSEIAAIESRHLRQAAQDAAGLPMTPVTPPGDPWACRSCTLKNAPGRATCQVCGTPRGQAYAPPAPSSSSGPARKTVQSTISFGVPVRSPPARTRQPAFASSTPARQVPSSSPSRPPGSGKRRQRPGAASTPPLQSPPPSNTQWPIAASPEPRTTGEDPEARQRYADIANRSAYPEIDIGAAHEFVYPTNYAVRDYQLTITEKALYHNTLVSLPTGLGKTLIASVVMYNFYRWFPRGKIVFMAPTKPLVAQQIKACHEIMGIPQADTAELQGSVSPAVRKVLWTSKRVFFCTPQSMQNDLQRGFCRAEDFVCVVVDEAHRATGNYAYCRVLQEIEQKTPFFRVLALSATPGSKFDIIQDVVKNLRISHIESRSADDSDVKKYTHARQEEVIVCRLSNQITEVKTLFMKVFQRIVHRLFTGNVIQYRDPEKLTRWYVLQAREKFRESPSYASNRSAESDLAMLISLLHAKNLLTVHGLSSFKEYVMNWVKERQDGKRLSWSKKELLQSTEFRALELSLNAGGGGIGTGPINAQASHPKLAKLREVLHEHFQRHSSGGSSTRAIVFTQYRTSVVEIVDLLKPLAPLLKVQQFVGQGTSGKQKENKGQSQKQQQEIVQKFRQGHFNVLVATCIAEEGLDIGEVDLIVSFDALTSPVRMIQRMGRTGRKRVGKVIILVTEGDEEKKLARSAAAAKTVNRALTTFKNKFSYSKCPRMIPTGIRPSLTRLEMSIPKFEASKVAGKQITGGEGHTKRRYENLGIVVDESWKLNDIERSIGNAKFFPEGFNSSERNLLHPLVVPRGFLLRSRSAIEGRASSLFGYSRKSFVLLSMVRKINGVDEDGWEREMLIQKPRNASIETEEEADVIPMKDQARSGFAPPTHLDDSISLLSDPMNESYVDNSFHFSPQYIDPVPDSAPFVCVKTKRTTGPDVAKNGTEKDVELSSKPPFTSELNSIVQKKTPSMAKKASERRLAITKPGLISPEELERGESLIEQLQELRSLLRSLSQNSPTSKSGVESGDNTTHQENVIVLSPTQELPTFPRLRISRQLAFDETGPKEQSDQDTIDNCVPEPPAIVESPKKLLLPPVSTNQEDPAEITAGIVTQHPAPSKPVIVLAVTTPVSRPRRSLSLRVLDETNGAPLEEESVETEVAKIEDMPSRPPKGPIDLTMETSQPDESLVVLHAEKISDIKNIVDLTSRSPVNVNPPNKRRRLIPGGLKRQKEVSTPAGRVCFSAATEATQREDDTCSVCREAESFEDDPIVFCDGCEIAVHQFCYGIAQIPKESWFCDSCRASTSSGPRTQRRCHLCPLRGGAMKRTTCGHWVHVQCYLWIPELQLQKNKSGMVLDSLDTLDPDRNELECSLCHSQTGRGIIQCAYKRCLTAFHVSCAAFARHKLVQIDPAEGHENHGSLFLAYCPLHQNATYIVPAPARILASTAASPKAVSTPKQFSAGAHVSPSTMLLSMAENDDSAKKFSKFRRLKRKYDSSQSPAVNTTRPSPEGSSPWTKRIRRSKSHTERRKLRAMASLFIESEVDVRGGKGDEYGEEEESEADAVDDSFINDSSQLYYSQESPSQHPDKKMGKKKRKRRDGSLPGDMRAIYARSLLESPDTPAFLRRALPANGIISACLEELDKSVVRKSDEFTHGRATNAIGVEEIDEILSTATEVSPAKDGSSHQVEANESYDDVELEPPPSFALLSGISTPFKALAPNPASHRLVTAGALLTSAVPADLGTSESVTQATTATISKPAVPVAMPSAISSAGGSVTGRTDRTPPAEAGDDGVNIRARIEANRLKALEKLQQRRAQMRMPVEATHYGSSAHHRSNHQPRQEVVGGSSFESEAPSFQLLGSLAEATNSSPTPVPAVMRKDWGIFVSADFSSSPAFAALLSTNMSTTSIDIDDTLEADVLLSVRLAVLYISTKEVDAFMLRAADHPRVRQLNSIFKKLVVAIEAGPTGPTRVAEVVNQLQRIPNIKVLVRRTQTELGDRLLRLAE